MLARLIVVAALAQALAPPRQRHRLTPHVLDLRNSGDTAGDRDRVVGYASIAFSEDLDRAHH